MDGWWNNLEKEVGQSPDFKTAQERGTKDEQGSVWTVMR